MADKKISDLTAAGSAAIDDVYEIENSGGNSRKVTGAQIKAMIGAGSKCVVVGSGNYIWPDTFTSAGSTVSISTGTLRFYPFSRACTLSSLAFEVTTLTAGENSRMGLYAANSTTGLPDTLIEECTSQSLGSTGIKNHPFASNRATTGLVWIAHTVSATVVCRSAGTFDEAAGLMGAASLNLVPTALFNRITASFTHGALPANTSGLTLGFSNTTNFAAVARLA